MEPQKSIGKSQSKFKKFFEYDENVVICSKYIKSKEPPKVIVKKDKLPNKNKVSTIEDPLKDDPFFFF